MHISFDQAKNDWNIRVRGLSFLAVTDFDFENALYIVDDRRDYGELRYVALGMLHGRLHVLCFVETGEGIRVISFRKANAREVKRYEETQIID